MHDPFSASGDQMFQSQAPRSASNGLNPMQASSFNDQGRSSSPSNTQLHPEDHALPFPLLHNTSPYSQASAAVAQPFDANELVGHRSNVLVGAYSSSYGPKTPSLAQPSHPLSFDQGLFEDFECVAAPGVDCYCHKCLAAVPDQQLLDPVQIHQEQLAPHQAYSQDIGRSFGGAELQHSTNRSQNSLHIPSYLNYSQTDTSHPGFGLSAYPSMPVTYGNSSGHYSTPSSFSRNPHQVSSSQLDRSFQNHQPGMRYCVPDSMELQVSSVPNRPQLKIPGQLPMASQESASCSILDEDTFFVKQDLLDLAKVDSGPLSVHRKQELATLLNVSLPQLEHCIGARRLIPVIKHLANASIELGVPANYLVRWVMDMQPTHQPNRHNHDSAYASNKIPAKDDLRPTKKRKRGIGNENEPKKFQCTHIEDGKYCLKDTDNSADWRRHEETHYPQRRWECLIQGSGTNATCHYCGGPIDLNGQPPSISHGLCLNRIFRAGHQFARRDKLIRHVKEIHKCPANVDTWYIDRTSNWKRQCGFCGSTFTDWNTRCDHVIEHFISRKRMIPDWKDPWTEEDGAPDNPSGDDDDGDNDNDDLDGEGESESDDDAGTRRWNFGNHQSDPRSDSNSKNAYGSSTKTPSHPNPETYHQSEHTSQACDESPILETMDECQRLEHNGPDKNTKNDSPRLASGGSPVPRSNGAAFKFVKKLGYGAFGTVDEVFHTGTKKLFARKSIRAALHHSLPALAQARREVFALRGLRHVHIIGVIASYTSGDQFSIIMSPVAEWNLSEYMLSGHSPPLNKVSNLSTWIGCLTSAVSYMHRKFWQHLDIKPSNILIARGRVILSDFGGALFMGGSQLKTSVASSYAITPMYCAPELTSKGPRQITSGASDIYSLGCVFLEMVTVIHRQRVSSFEVLRAASTGNASYHSNLGISWDWIHHLSGIDESLGLDCQQGLRVIASMLSDDPRKRPTAQSIEQSYLFYRLSTTYQMGNQFRDEQYLFVTAKRVSENFDPMIVARQWLDNCSKNHTGCSNLDKDFFPSRILNVGTKGEYIHLQSSIHPESPYVALSHCWGSSTVLKTTEDNLSEMETAIEVSSLSRAFADAVRITRDLGFKYLWIDSLCIVQDSAEDWISESSVMHKIYSHSSLTICLANDGNADFVDQQAISGTTQTPTSNSKCPTCIHGPSKFHALCEDTPTTMLLDSPWSQRAWTLQERMLSPRVLYYSSTRMAWECRGNRSTLDIVSRMRQSLKTLSTIKSDSRKRCYGSPLRKPCQSFSNLWRDVVKEYSKRQLSVSQDKLPALAGVASEIASLSGHKYLAGLWSHDLIHSLLWCRDFATTPLPPPLEYRAPSWSWAAIDSPVTWSKAMLDFPDDEEVKIIKCKVVPQSAKSPFGRVSEGGYLKIQGRMHKVLIERARSHDVLDVETRVSFAFAQWDCSDTQHDKKLRLEGRDRAKELWCLRILDSTGFLLREVKDGPPDTFRRVGVYRIHESRGGLPDLGETRPRGDLRTVVII